MTSNHLSYQVLKTKHRELRKDFPQGLSVRVHRALSWLDKSEQCGDDLDAQVIFLWISLNAAYAQHMHELYTESTQESIHHFLKKINDLDTENVLYQMVWSEFSNSIHNIIKHKFLYSDFWKFQRGDCTQQKWEISFQKSQDRTKRALSNKNTALVIKQTLSCIYMLRNQLVHGGATWNGSVNRDQIKLSEQFLRCLVPNIINIMMDNPHTIWGSEAYPVIDA